MTVFEDKNALEFEILAMAISDRASLLPTVSII